MGRIAASEAAAANRGRQRQSSKVGRRLNRGPQGILWVKLLAAMPHFAAGAATAEVMDL
jgi:hypothetical protein